MAFGDGCKDGKKRRYEYNGLVFVYWWDSARFQWIVAKVCTKGCKEKRSVRAHTTTARAAAAPHSPRCQPLTRAP